MATEKINEKIDVITIFKKYPAKVSIYKIRWNGRDHFITKEGYYHKVREGRKVYHIFSVCSATLAFRLRFDPETMYWNLEEISDGLAD